MSTVILILVSQRAEVQAIQLFGPEWMVKELEKELLKQRGNGPTYLELVVVVYVLGKIPVAHRLSYYTYCISIYIKRNSCSVHFDERKCHFFKDHLRYLKPWCLYSVRMMRGISLQSFIQINSVI